MTTPAIEMMQEIAEAVKNAELELVVNGRGSKVRVFVVPSTASAAAVSIPKKTNPIDSAPAKAPPAKRAKVDVAAPAAAAPAAAKPKRLHTNFDTVAILKEVFGQFKSTNAVWDFNEFIQMDGVAEKLAWVFNHYGESSDGRNPKSKLFIGTQWKRFEAGQLESRKGKMKQKKAAANGANGNGSANGTHDAHSSESESEDDE